MLLVKWVEPRHHRNFFAEALLSTHTHTYTEALASQSKSAIESITTAMKLVCFFPFSLPFTSTFISNWKWKGLAMFTADRRISFHWKTCVAAFPFLFWIRVLSFLLDLPLLPFPLVLPKKLNKSTLNSNSSCKKYCCPENCSKLICH